LRIRDDLQSRIDAWHIARHDAPIDAAEYRAFLTSIDYLVPEPEPFAIGTTQVDAEIATMAGPQLVVPVLNARFVLNAANARWGSLYDALYGTDALPGSPAGNSYDAVRGGQVIERGKTFLDEVVPLSTGSWKDFSGGDLALAEPAQLIGRSGESWLFKHNGLHIEVVVDRAHRIGRTDPAGIADILLESALSTIVDLEDSVAAVDADDKVAAYTNWLGLMRGDLEETFDKGGVAMTRRLKPDRVYEGAGGGALILPGRSILFVRNVGHLMTTPAVLLDGVEVPEGILDAIMTSTIALYDLNGVGSLHNSRTGSVYIVKPKMHGPAEAAFTNRLFDAVEDLLTLARHTIKVGVMDEERRTSANLAATIEAVRDRVAFINT
ncbi:MAG: malate synthase G, partial [Sphingomonas sp.]|nr:malate synthase G [Sphingomonas sp.]